MGKVRRMPGMTGSPVTNDLGYTPTPDAMDYTTRAALGTSFYKQNAGARDVGGRAREAQFANDYFKGRILGFDTGNVTDDYQKFGPNSFNPFSNSTDFEKIRKDNQGLMVASTNMLGQFVAKTTLNTVGGVIGSFYGLGSAAANWDASKIADNSFMRGLDEASEKVDEFAPVFTSQKDKENGALGMFSGLETMKSVSDAFAFTAGAVATEFIMQTVGNAATGFLQEAGLPARLAMYASKAGKIFSQENAFGRTLVRGTEHIGVGDRLRRIGDKARLAEAILDEADNPVAKKILQEAAMREGMSVDQLKNRMIAAQRFKNVWSGTRKVISGSLYEGTLEGRQAYDQMMANANTTIDAQLNAEGYFGEKREIEKQRRLALAEEDAKGMMLGVTAANVGLLAVSNAVQFPTLFGLKSFPETKGLNNMSSFFTRNAATGVVEEVAKKGAAKIGAKAIGVFEHPVQEFLEETLQGVISKTSVNYHDRLTNVASQTGGTERTASDFMSSIGEAFGEQYGSKEGWEEGLIGAIVGGIGAPTFKRTKSGRIVPTIQGGIIESLSGKSKLEKDRIQASLNVLQSDSQLNALKYNFEQTKLNTFSTGEQNKAVASEDSKAFESAGTDQVFQHVANYLDKGLQDHLEEETEALKAMSPEEYTAKTRGKDAEVISAEEKEKELKDYIRKVDTYKKAYEKVFKSMNMEKMNDNPVTQRLLNHLAYALAKDKEELLEFDNQSKALRNLGLKMTDAELYKLADTHSKIGSLSQEEIQAELSKYDNEEHPDYIAKINKLVEEEFAQSAKSGEIDIAKDADYLRKMRMKYKLKPASIMDKARRDALERSIKEEKEAFERSLNPSEEELSTEVEKKFIGNEFTSAYNEALKKKMSERFKAENKYNKADYITEEQLNDEVAQEEAKKAKLNREAGEKFQAKQSAAMNFLAGKQKRLTLQDIQDYKNSLEAYKSQLAAESGVKKSFLDNLDAEQNKDFDKVLDMLAGTISRREDSLRVAANLYGLSNVNHAIQSVVKAELITNYNNNQHFRELLLHFMSNKSEDDTDVESALAYSKLQVSVNNLRKMTDEAKVNAISNGVDPEKNETILLCEKEIAVSNSVMLLYKNYIDGKIAKEEAAEKILNDKKGDSSKEITDKILKDKKVATQEEIDEAMTINDLILKYGELLNQPKQSWELYTSSESPFRDGNLRELVEKGVFGVNNVVYFRPVQNLELTDSAIALMSKEQVAMYNKGKALYEADPTIIGVDGVMDVSRFLSEDGKLEFDDSNDAAIQFFTMTFVSSKDITNDTSKEREDGTKRISKKTGDDRRVASSFLYSPYFAFEKTDEKADNFVATLKEQKRDLAILSRKLEDERLTAIQKADIEKTMKLLRISITAKELRANDATLYELRRKMLVELNLHKNSSLRDEPYEMKLLIRDFNYGEINEHSIAKEGNEGKSNFPLINVGEHNEKNFDVNDYFLSDEQSVEKLFAKDKLAICYKDKRLVRLNSNKDVGFSKKDSEKTEEELAEDAEAEAEGKGKTTKDIEGIKESLTVGAMYYLHETANGVIVPVKLNQRTISDSESTMDGLRKHIRGAIEYIRENETDKDKSMQIYDAPISLEPGDFNGMFDNDPDAPKTIHKLVEYFLPHYNSVRDLSLDPMVFKGAEDGRPTVNNKEQEDEVAPEVVDTNAVTEDATEDKTDVDKALEKYNNKSSKSKSSTSTKSSGKDVKLVIDFGTEKVSIKDFSETHMEEIMKKIGSMRFYFKKTLSIDQSKEPGKKLVKPNVLNFALSSGLITHGFDTKTNVEKIYNPFENMPNKDGKYNERQISLTLKPMDDDVLGKTKRILGDQYAFRNKKRFFSSALRDVFKLEDKTREGKAIPFTLNSINRQIIYTVDKRFKELLIERRITSVSPEEERAKAYKDAFESRVALMKEELASVKEKFGNKNREELFSIIEKQIKKFEDQYKDPKNKATFRAMYLKKTQKENFDDLNQLLFKSSEMNNDFSEIMPELSKPLDSETVSFGKGFQGISEAKIDELLSAIEDHKELSSFYNKIGNKGYLPISVQIGSVGSKTSKRETIETIMNDDDEFITKGNKGKQIKIHKVEDSKGNVNEKVFTFYHLDSDGKISGIKTSDIKDYLVFDGDSSDKNKNKLKRGALFLHLTGHPQTFFPIAIGTETMNAGYDALKRDKGVTFRYLSGINFYGRNKDLSKNRAEANKITNALAKVVSIEKATEEIYRKLKGRAYQGKTPEERFEIALAIAQEELDKAEDAKNEYAEIIKKASSSRRGSKKEDVGSDLGGEADKYLKRKEDLISVLEGMAPAPGDPGDDDPRYFQENVTKGFLNDFEKAKKIDFEKMSKTEFAEFLDKETSEGEGAAKELFIEALSKNEKLAKSAMNGLIKSMTEKIERQERAEKRKTEANSETKEEKGALTAKESKLASLANIGNEEDVEEEEEEEEEYEDDERSPGLLTVSQADQIKSLVEDESERTLKRLIGDVKRDNLDADNLNYDIFVEAASIASSMKEKNGEITNSKNIHLLAKIIYEDDYSKEEIDNIIEEYNKSCEV